MLTQSSVKIGAATYTLYIEAKKWNPLKEKEGASGLTDLHTQEIFVDPTMSLTNIKETVLHECLHAMFADSGVTWPVGGATQEEKIVRILSPRFLQFILDNKELVEWIVE